MKRRAPDWKKCAAELAIAVPRDRLHPAVVAWAETRSAGERWAVAFSGGVDSLALLLLLWAHWPQRRSRLVALHFNHRLRGAESRGDAVFCLRVCAALGIELVAGQWEDAPKKASEAAARTARFDFFQQALRARRMRVLWLGQQQDDIAETMLMRISRGSGTSGLAAPRPLQEQTAGRIHVRPLLTLKKGGIVAALRSVAAKWREDSSNAGEDYFRNRLRKMVVPAWCKASGRDALAGAALARELLAEDDAALEQWLNELAVEAKDGALELAKLRGKPRALLRRALHRWLGAQKGLGELSRQGFERLLTASETGGDTRQSLGRRAFAVIHTQRLSIQKTGRRAD
ncbi:MAG: tRNA lysidine(34) synthetase TilS [Undibacterium sp.]|nr:tRNA lysidine(34) synthetase TilS [Opitutaceae bacterium]